MNIIIVGTHSSDWNNALHEKSPLWSLLDVKTVSNVTDIESLKTCKNEAFFIPMQEKHYIWLYESLALQSHLPNQSIFKSFANKKLFESYVVNHNIQNYVPSIYTKDNYKLPMVIKGSIGSSGNCVKICYDEEGYEEVEIMQEFIPGCSEFVTFLVVKEGNIIEELTYEHTFDFDAHIAGQDHKKTSKYHQSPEVVDILSKFMCEYHGVATIDYKIYQGKVYVMEINPRLGGTLMANLDSLAIILKAWFTL